MSSNGTPAKVSPVFVQAKEEKRKSVRLAPNFSLCLTPMLPKEWTSCLWITILN